MVPPYVWRYGDWLLAGGIAALAQLQIWSAGELSSTQKPILAGAALLVAGLFVVRTRAAFVVSAAVLGLAIVESALPEAQGGEWIGLFILLGVYTAAAHTNGWRAAVAGAFAAVAAVVIMVGDSGEIDLGGILFFSFLFGTPWVAGRAIRHRRLREAQLEREKADAEAAITEERRRIARELHDVVAHAISVIVLQARGGRKLLDEEPEQTREALDAIERTAGQALTEMRRLLDLLRDSDEQPTLSPQPSLARIDDLARRVREAGLPVEVAVEGDPKDVPPGVDLSGYRIVQEALTNVLKHAGRATAQVTVRYGDGELDIEISDDGRGSHNGAGAGSGLTGIRERVALFGGDVEARRRPEGGWFVRARLPYADEQ